MPKQLDEEDAREITNFLAVIAEYSLTGWRVAGALGELLVEKGVLTREEIDARLRLSADESKNMVARLRGLPGYRPH